MGFKRPFDDEMFHELPFKHSRQIGFSDKSTQFEEFIPRHHAVPQKPLATVVSEGDLSNPQGSETFDEESNFVYNGFDVDGCFDRVMKDCEGFAHSPHSAKYCELGLVPPRPCSPVETLYSFLLDQPARKQVPVGPDHQAVIPEWEGSLGNQEASDTSKLSGTCVVPLPALDIPANIDGIVGKGRELCVCQDRGSIRCVRQHVKEAREEVVKVLGSEKFRELGFCEMGEVVAQRWSDEDAILFHEIVYSNPVTLGRNFWNHLEAAFFSRAKHEIVSFYFNVFVLRRRATQNRSLMLDVDSDDDEWHGGYGGSLGTQYVEEDEDDEEEEEEDSAVESPLRQGTDKFNEKVHPFHQEDGEEGVSDNDDVDTREGGAEHMATFNEERLNVEDDVSYTTFELGHDALDSVWTNCTKKDETGVGEHQKKSKEGSDPKVSTNGKDLQPTRSIMEEIFGHGSWGSK